MMRIGLEIKGLCFSTSSTTHVLRWTPSLDDLNNPASVPQKLVLEDAGGKPRVHYPKILRVFSSEDHVI